MKARALAAALALALAACGQSPTAPEPVRQAAPRFQGGGMTYGGGTYTTPTCYERGGGMMLGGGTFTEPCTDPL